jgi:transcriptional regulator with XRE-family HTH domain
MVVATIQVDWRSLTAILVECYIDTDCLPSNPNVMLQDDKDRWFNAQLLKLLREELSWTQEALAARAGLSVRVIAKAENGERVSPRTIMLLVQSFRDSGKIVEPTDFTINAETLAQRFLQNYAVHQADCVPHSLDLLSPDIVAFVAGDPATNPIAGTYHGLEEFDGLWRKFFAIFVRDGGSLVDQPLMRTIGKEVFAWGQEYIRVPQAGPMPPGFVALRMRFEGGLMTYFEDHYEAYGMMWQLEAWAKEFPDADWIQHVDREQLADRAYRRALTPPQPPREFL